MNVVLIDNRGPWKLDQSEFAVAFFVRSVSLYIAVVFFFLKMYVTHNWIDAHACVCLVIVFSREVYIGGGETTTQLCSSNLEN